MSEEQNAIVAVNRKLRQRKNGKEIKIQGIKGEEESRRRVRKEWKRREKDREKERREREKVETEKGVQRENYRMRDREVTLVQLLRVDAFLAAPRLT